MSIARTETLLCEKTISARCLKGLFLFAEGAILFGEGSQKQFWSLVMRMFKESIRCLILNGKPQHTS